MQKSNESSLEIYQEKKFWANREEPRSFLKTSGIWMASVSPRVLNRSLFATSYALLVTLFCLHEMPHLHLSVTPFEYSGVFLGLLLVFRLNAGYDRWWEGRKAWGGIVNQTRNLAMLIGTHRFSSPEKRQEVFALLSLWPVAMMDQLRFQKLCSDNLRMVESLLGLPYRATLARQNNSVNWIGTRLARTLAMMRREGLDGFTYLQIEKQRCLMIDHYGVCERIKSTPPPLIIAIKLRRFIFIFLTALPFALLDELDWAAPFVFSVVAYALFSLDQIGLELQRPFQPESLSHLPLDTICNNISRNIAEVEHAADLAQGLDPITDHANQDSAEVDPARWDPPSELNQRPNNTH